MKHNCIAILKACIPLLAAHPPEMVWEHPKWLTTPEYSSVKFMWSLLKSKMILTIRHTWGMTERYIQSESGPYMDIGQLGTFGLFWVKRKEVYLAALGDHILKNCLSDSHCITKRLFKTPPSPNNKILGVLLIHLNSWMSKYIPTELLFWSAPSLPLHYIKSTK